jgi:cold shock protein
MQGIVKFFNPERGFGFISPDAHGRDVFVHVKQVRGDDAHTISEGQRVSYDLVTDPRTGRLAAGNVHVVRERSP